VDPPCPIADRCGGCPIQQVTYDAQLAAKQELTADALERIGGFARDSYELAPIVRSPKQFHYRRRAVLHRVPGGWGFDGTQVDECLLFEPELQKLAEDVRLFKLPGATDLALLAPGAVDVRGEVSRKHAEELLAVVRGVTLKGQTLGNPVVADLPLPNGARLRSRPDTFAQANREMVPLLQQAALQAVGDAQRVREFFCGSGTLTLPLLGTREVTAVEQAGPSLSLLRKSADEAGLNVRLIAGDAAKIARETAEPVDAVLLDPPRTGAATLMPHLHAPRIVYVSCDAPTLARDGKLLAARGYKLTRATPLDLFPQTAHYEVVAVFEQ
jgi:23S rRNA (uracil1939-C5)-methyltransferase